MNYLSVHNNFLKTHNNNSYLLTGAQQNFINDDNGQVQENNNRLTVNKEKTIKEVWSQHKFDVDKVKVATPLANMTWAKEKPFEQQDQPPDREEAIQEDEKVDEVVHVVEKEESPSHHARRPPNAFLIFCKKHRPIVRDRFPNLENRGVTKILGEWWALLKVEEKQPYNDLAKEYKDAFLSANPDFRWYKLPAPPLRTLAPRPTALTSKVPLPLSSPSSSCASVLSEFTPGKLADESQLGGLTSLMNKTFNNNNYNATPKTQLCSNENNNNQSVMCEDQLKDKHSVYGLVTPKSDVKVCIPPKPLKKRFGDYNNLQNQSCARNILDKIQGNEDDSNSNISKQDIVNKAVDEIFKQDESPDGNGTKEPRKSDRMCKGKRYEKFMVEGKLLGNKRDGRQSQNRQNKIANSANSPSGTDVIKTEVKSDVLRLDLNDTIKRLAERTNVKLEEDFTLSPPAEAKEEEKDQRSRTTSETSEGDLKAGCAASFNLDLRIRNLSCLGYDEFLQRKRECKKRKIKKTDGGSKSKVAKVVTQPSLVGSKKRKNKRSITHLGGNKEEAAAGNDLLGLEFLAEVAANTEKINEKISE